MLLYLSTKSTCTLVLSERHIHLTVSTLLGIEAILCLLDVCKALENLTSTGKGLVHIIQHSIKL